MKLAIVTPVLGSAGGMGQVVEEHASHLAARGHDVTVFVPVIKQETLSLYRSIAPSFVITPIKPRLRYGHGAWIPQLTKMLDGFDVVHFHYPFIGGTGAVIKWRGKPIDQSTSRLVNWSTSQLVNSRRLVITYHMDLVGRGLFRPLFRSYQRIVLPRLLRAADRITVSSLDYAEHGDLARYLPTLRDRLVELPFGVDTEKFEPREPDGTLIRELAIGLEESVILFVGGLDRAHYFKGVPVLLRALALLREETKAVRLIIAGLGRMIPTYRQLARRLQIADAVLFASNISAPDLLRYYSIADVVVLPSTDRSEAFGLVLLEASSCGRPVIASNLPGVRTVLEDQRTGLLIPPSDSQALMQALAWILTHPEERAAMGRAARARIEEKYRWDPIIDRLESIYKEISV